VNKVINEILRKALHILLSLLLLAPILMKPWIRPEGIYAIALIVGGWIYSMQVRGLPHRLKASMHIPQPKGVEVAVEAFNRLVSLVERDYERRTGWLGMLSGLLGVSSTYFLFGDLVMYGILALVLTDGLSAIVGISLGRTKVPFSDGSLEGTLAGFLSYLIALLLLGINSTNSVVIAIVSTLSELYGGEDNISVPLASTLTAFLLGVPPLISQ